LPPAGPVHVLDAIRRQATDWLHILRDPVTAVVQQVKEQEGLWHGASRLADPGVH
jgi:hypothetical protein